MPPAWMRWIKAVIAKLHHVDNGAVAAGQLHLETRVSYDWWLSIWFGKLYIGRGAKRDVPAAAHRTRFAIIALNMRSLAIVLASIPVFLMAGCNRTRSNPQGRVAEPYLPDTASVSFDLEPVERAEGSLQMKATYASQGKIARFIIELERGKVSNARDAQDFPVRMGNGRFKSEQGSDASILLADLQKALEAKTLPKLVPKSTSLPFTFAILGERQSQASGGGFHDNPRGDWTAMKIFLGQGDQEAEVFLNFNLVMRKGQFSMKDADYGDAVLLELAKVL